MLMEIAIRTAVVISKVVSHVMVVIITGVLVLAAFVVSELVVNRFFST